MNASSHGPHPGQAPHFAELMHAAMAGADRFGHRQHLHLTWLAVRRYGTATAAGLVSECIQQTARYAGAPQKYNATVTLAWVQLVGHHAAASDTADFDTFAARHPALLDKRLLTRFYRPATLASALARARWVEPDLAPFPWNSPGRSGSTASTTGTLPPHDLDGHAR